MQAIRLYQTAPDAPGDPSATNAVNFIQATVSLLFPIWSVIM